MRTYECNNCHSLFIINESDPRVQSGDYNFEPGATIYCSLCSGDMSRVDRKQEEEKDDAVPNQNR